MNNVLYVNKPKGISSFDVCYRLRKILGTKRIGHTGTLDPNATGVMVVLFNDATKGAQFLVSDTKVYKTKVLLGVETDTLDIDGNVVNKKEYVVPERDLINEVFNSFLGKSKQQVPLTSAKKINGKKLYQYQLEGKEVELPIIDIEVFDIKLDEILDNGFTFTCKVSSGTYIRSLVRDILKKMDLIGTVEELCRIAVDNITIDECNTLEDIENGRFEAHDLLDLLSNRYKTYEIEKVEDIKNGKRIKIDCDDEYVVLTDNGKLLAVYKKDGEEYRSARGLW